METCLLQENLPGSLALRFSLHSFCKHSIKAAYQDFLFLASSSSLVSLVMEGTDTGDPPHHLLPKSGHDPPALPPFSLAALARFVIPAVSEAASQREALINTRKDALALVQSCSPLLLQAKVAETWQALPGAVSPTPPRCQEEFLLTTYSRVLCGVQHCLGYSSCRQRLQENSGKRRF